MSVLYPVFLKLEQKPVLVVGGGAVALRRVERLLEAGARVTLVAPRVVDRLAALGDERKLEWRRRLFEETDLDGAALVFLATGDAALAGRVREETSRRGILLSSAEDEAFSDFHTSSRSE